LVRLDFGARGVIRAALARLFGRPPMLSAPSGAPDPIDPNALARSPDPVVREAVAAGAETPPELLYFLARDPAPAVRAAVARNPATPRKADLLLALDDQPAIRTLIAEKMAAHVEAHGRDEAAQLWQLTVSVLEALAQDDLPGVRRHVAELARGLDRLPVEIVTRLGADRVVEIALPALAYPGTIPDPDLVEIVVKAPDPRVVGAVARRPAIGAAVSERIVASGDTAAIETLLQNRSAEIASVVLDAVIERAPPVTSWHAPLVHRPSLTAFAVRRLAGFVGETLLGVLKQRSDLAPLEPGVAEVIMPVAPPSLITVTLVESAETPLARARRHYAQGTLSEDLIGAALGADQDFVIAALALRARLLPAVVAKILVSHSAKGLTALAWKAGYTMRLALQLQIRLARLPPKARLNASRGGSFPLTPAEMEWQIEFFQSLVPAGM
jgi:uncharacterized protein (DUF2336 family)